MLSQANHQPYESYFLKNLNSRIEPYLSDCNLSINKLTQLIGMSRTDLHRKLSKEAGMSATKYIRYLRIKKAAHLLLTQPHRNVFQIALDVGFSNQGYFSRRFKEVFKICPKDFRAKQFGLEHMSKKLEHIEKHESSDKVKFVPKEIIINFY